MQQPLPPPVDAVRDSAPSAAAIPAFAYRSEAFAEDLSIFEDPPTVPRPRALGRRRRAFAVSVAWMWRRARRRLRPTRR